MAYWGLGYLRSCVLILSSASGPVVYDLPTKAGPLKLRAEAFQVQLNTNLIHLSKVTVREPDGALLASVNSAVLQNAIPESLSYHRPILAEVSGASIKIIRLPNGTLDIQRFLPERTETTSQIPFSVRLINGRRNPVRVDLVDLAGATKWERSATVGTLNLEGVGQRWVAGGSAAVQGIGVGNVEVRKDPDTGLSIDGRVDLADAIPLFRHVIDLPQAAKAPNLRRFNASTLQITGPVAVFVPNQGRPTFEADVRASGTGVSYENEFFATTADFSGVFTADGLEGSVDAAAPGASVHYVGGLSWGKELAMGGALDAKVASLAAAPKVVQRFVAGKVDFRNGAFSGWLNYSGKNEIAITGTASADLASFQKQTVQAPRARLVASSQRVAIDFLSGSWQGSPVHGALNFAPQTKNIEGLITSNSVSLASLAKMEGWPNVSGTTNVEALVTGTSNNPYVSIRVDGQASAKAKGRLIKLGHVVAAADYSQGLLTLDRVSVHGPNGIVTAVGKWAQKSNQLDIDLVGSGMPLSLFEASLTGSAAFVGKIKGASSAPYAQGRLELYDASYHDQSIPLVLADVNVSRNILKGEDVQAFRGATRVRGNLSYDLANGALNGTAQADEVSLSDLSKGAVSGTAAVTSAKIGGTLEHIRISGSLSGSNIVAEGVKVDKVDGQFSVNGAQALLSGSAYLDQGSFTGSATYDFDTRSGQFSGSGSGLSLAELSVRLPAETAITGGLNANFEGQFGSGQLLAFKSSGQMQDLTLNNSPLGGGIFSLNESKSIWSGSLDAGSLDRYFELTNVQYDTAAKTIHADLAAHNLSLENVLSAAKPYIASDSDTTAKKEAAAAVLPSSAVAEIGSISGDVDALATIDGPAKDPNLVVPTLVASNLSYQGRASGTLQAKASLTKGIWTIPSLTWNGGPGQASLSGTINPRGDVDLQGAINNVNPQWLAMFVPAIDRLSSNPNVSFSVSGPAKAPIINSTLQYLEGAAGSPTRTEVAMNAKIQPGQITATGDYFYKGLAGALNVDVPFEYPLTIPQDRSVVAEATLPSHSLADLEPFFPWIDPKRTSGNLSGDVKLSGLPDKLQVSGQAVMTAPTLGIKNVDTFFKSVQANLGFNGSRLDLNASADGSQGGSIGISNASLDLGNASNILQESLETLLEDPVTGSLNLNNLRFVQKGSTPMDATFAGGVTASGKLHSPKLQGTISLLQGTVSVPNAPTNEQEPLHPTINPTFDIALSMPNTVNVNAGLGVFQLTGGGNLAGTLALPNLDAQLVVDKGSIQLPNARIGIDPGGTIHIVYDANTYGMPLEQANVDVTGSTALTANPYGNVVQRYDVNLQVRGDLLAQNGLEISAQSNPPDLSQDQILMLLGQGGVFLQQNMANAEAFRTDQQLQQAAFTALPLLFNPVTQRLAAGLGLDYLDVEYNPFEGVAVTAARSLSKNLIISARRQISQPLPGQLRAYDVRLSYRLPLKGKIYRNLNLILETTQLYPYRVGLEYGFRF